MAEEQKPAEGASETPEVKEPTAVELKAMEQGWRPLDEWDGEPEDFVEAKEYVARKPLFDKISQTSKALKESNKALEAFKNHYAKVRKTEYERALETLRTKRDQAIEESDSRQARAIEGEIKTLENEAAENQRLAQIQLVQEAPAEHPEFVSWKSRNQWYESTLSMKAWADVEGARLASTGLQPVEVLKQLEKAVKKEFPHKFTNPNKQNAPDVDSSRGNTKGSTKSREDSLTAQERDIMNTLVRGGHITKEKYFADIDALDKAKGRK